MTRVLVTGANGHLGRRLIRELPDTWEVSALVRRERARTILLEHVGERAGLDVSIADPGDAGAVAAAAAGCTAAVHLVGTIRGVGDDAFRASHQVPAQALAQAAARVGLAHVVYVSILGADAASASACLRARAAVEALLREAPVPATLLRVPMVLGEGDRASGALARRVRAKRVFLLRADSLEQPVYAGDVTAALAQALAFDDPRDTLFELAGPESLTRRALIARAAAAAGRSPTVHSLPLALGLAFAGLLETLGRTPPVSRDMLRVLDHDDAIDPAPAAAALGVTLTPLDEMLRRCIVPRVS